MAHEGANDAATRIWPTSASLSPKRERELASPKSIVWVIPRLLALPYASPTFDLLMSIWDCVIACRLLHQTVSRPKLSWWKCLRKLFGRLQGRVLSNGALLVVDTRARALMVEFWTRRPHTAWMSAAIGPTNLFCLFCALASMPSDTSPYHHYHLVL